MADSMVAAWAVLLAVARVVPMVDALAVELGLMWDNDLVSWLVA